MCTTCGEPKYLHFCLASSYPGNCYFFFCSFIQWILVKHEFNLLIVFSLFLRSYRTVPVPAEGHFKWIPKELLLPCRMRMGGQRSCFILYPSTLKEVLTMNIWHVIRKKYLYKKEKTLRLTLISNCFNY